MGFCPQCRSDVPLTESGASAPIKLESQDGPPSTRTRTGIAEVDRVLGGGLVSGSVVLIGGEPGIGKSTLLGQLASTMASAGSSVLYASAEESVGQVKLRQDRIGSASLDIAATSDMDAIIASAAEYDVVIVDSIQTVVSSSATGAGGSVSQVRASAEQAVRVAKQAGTAFFLVGHITKDGSLAGPKTLEHMVDVVLYFESDGPLHVLRGMKNRFGTVWATGVFEMTGSGLVEVPDPSVLTISDRPNGVSGSVIMPSIVGRRCVLSEVQALVVPIETKAPPRRSTTGVAAARVHQILAVLERRGGVTLSNSEVYVSVMGGFRTDDPATDLAIAAAVVSAAYDTPLPTTAAFGELGLTGEIRPAQQSDVRVAECHRLGIERVLAAPVLKRIGDLVHEIKGQIDRENSMSNATMGEQGLGLASGNGRNRTSIVA